MTENLHPLFTTADKVAFSWVATVIAAFIGFVYFVELWNGVALIVAVIVSLVAIITVLLVRQDQQKRRAAQIHAGPGVAQASIAAAPNLENQEEVKPPAAATCVTGHERTRQSYVVINSVLFVAFFFCFCIVAGNFGWKFGNAAAPGSVPVSTLPSPSRFLIKLTDFLKAYWWVLFIMGGFLLRRVFGMLERRAGPAITSAVLRWLVKIQLGFLVALCAGGLLIKSWTP
jgi:hypothetical protein